MFVCPRWSVEMATLSSLRALFAPHNCRDRFLPPANEIARRQCFLYLSVILFTVGSAFPQCHGAGRPPPYRQTPYRQTSPRYGQQVGGKHPTGVHPCPSYFYIDCRYFLSVAIALTFVCYPGQSRSYLE